MKRVGEFPGLRTKGERLVAVAGLLIGAAGTSAGLAATGGLEATASRPVPQETQISNSEFFGIAKLLLEGSFCDSNDVVYGIIDHQIEREPDAVCYTTPIDRNVSVNNG